MTKEMIIEAVGYLGSFLVLVSFLMTSVVKLRIVNTIGSLIFMIYALIIKSYPTAVMNACLVLINLRFLWKSRQTEKELDLVMADKDCSIIQYLLGYYKEDIQKCFPGISFDFSDVNRTYIISCNGKPVGLTLGKLEGDKLDLLLDYSIPEYRDFSIGAYLINRYKEEGIKKLIYSGPTENHTAYLTKLGFIKTEGGYEKEL